MVFLGSLYIRYHRKCISLHNSLVWINWNTLASFQQVVYIELYGLLNVH